MHINTAPNAAYYSTNASAQVEQENIVVYGQEGTFVPGRDMEVHWRDPTLNIAWPHAAQYIVSSKDDSAPYLDKAIELWQQRNGK